jgi:hypothetical protein
VSDRLDQLSAAIAARLERVRGNLTDVEFATLVEDVARTAGKFEQFEQRHGDPPTMGPDSLARNRPAT